MIDVDSAYTGHNINYTIGIGHILGTAELVEFAPLCDVGKKTPEDDWIAETCRLKYYSTVNGCKDDENIANI